MIDPKCFVSSINFSNSLNKTPFSITNTVISSNHGSYKSRRVTLESQHSVQRHMERTVWMVELQAEGHADQQRESRTERELSFLFFFPLPSSENTSPHLIGR